MREDIKIKTNDSIFKLRVSGLLVKENKVLIVQMNNNGFYCLPGGHVELNEDSKEAVIREFEEETNIPVKIKKQIAIAENFFPALNKIKVHEIGIYYLLETDSDIILENFQRIEEDKGKKVLLDFRWIKTEEIDKVKFRPKFLMNKIIKNNYEFEHIIIKE